MYKKGSPKYDGNFEKIINNAKKEAEIYVKHGLDGIIIENMHDIPYLHPTQIGPETTAAMATICASIRATVPSALPLGLQVLAGGNREAIAIALASGCNFIRAEGFVFGHVADEGYMDACAGTLLRFRSNIKAENVKIFTDIKKKHSSHAITSDLNIVDVAKAAEFFASDGVIVTGTSTGEEASIEELKAVKSAVKVPVLIGSGVTSDNVKQYLSADGLIIGSYFKFDGKWENTVDEHRVANFMNIVKNLRTKS